MIVAAALDAQERVHVRAVVGREELVASGLQAERVPEPVGPDVVLRARLVIVVGERVSRVWLPVERQAQDLAEQLVELLARRRVPPVADTHEQRVAHHLAATDLVGRSRLKRGEHVGEVDRLANRLQAEGPGVRLEPRDRVSKEVLRPFVRVGDEDVAGLRVEADAGEPGLARTGRRLLRGLERAHLRERVHGPVVRDDFHGSAQLRHEVERIVRRGSRIRDERDRRREAVALGVERAA